jgi:hypothetical protein
MSTAYVLLRTDDATLPTVRNEGASGKYEGVVPSKLGVGSIILLFVVACACTCRAQLHEGTAGSLAMRGPGVVSKGEAEARWMAPVYPRESHNVENLNDRPEGILERSPDIQAPDAEVSGGKTEAGASPTVKKLEGKAEQVKHEAAKAATVKNVERKAEQAKEAAEKKAEKARKILEDEQGTEHDLLFGFLIGPAGALIMALLAAGLSHLCDLIGSRRISG